MKNGFFLGFLVKITENNLFFRVKIGVLFFTGEVGDKNLNFFKKNDSFLREKEKTITRIHSPEERGSGIAFEGKGGKGKLPPLTKTVERDKVIESGKLSSLDYLITFGF